MFFFDWLKTEQDFGYQLPLVGDRAYQNIHVETGEAGSIAQPAFNHPGSFCTTVSVKVSGSRLTISGNPSRYGRIDNLFGLRTLDQCVEVFNSICDQLGLPRFTRCTRTWVRQGEDGSKPETVSDGAIIKEVHITTNRAVGQGNEQDYLKGLATINYRNSMPRLHSNGMTVDWLSKLGNANLIYPSVYNKAHEIGLHSLVKIKNKFGDDSIEYQYLLSVVEYCRSHGIVRFEQKIKGRMLTRLGARYWGLFDERAAFEPLQREFLNIDERLQVTAMDYDTISDQLIRSGVVETTRAANTTAMYAIQWMHGKSFDLGKSQVQTHRARLRKIGIDIAQTCDISRFSPVFVTRAEHVTVRDITPPQWYQMPQVIRLVA